LRYARPGGRRIWGEGSAQTRKNISESEIEEERIFLKWRKRRMRTIRQISGKY